MTKLGYCASVLNVETNEYLSPENAKRNALIPNYMAAQHNGDSYNSVFTRNFRYGIASVVRIIVSAHVNLLATARVF
jgi:hypothetical protein